MIYCSFYESMTRLLRNEPVTVTTRRDGETEIRRSNILKYCEKEEKDGGTEAGNQDF